jgi:sugar phosphate isomerase/epimerase
MEVYIPGWDPSLESYANATIDLSHSSVAHSDPLEMAERLGSRLRHIHLTDGTGSAKDEHLVPGRGDQPAAELLQRLAGSGFSGHVVVEINTRRSGTAQQRDLDLAESLAFARQHLAVGTPG